MTVTADPFRLRNRLSFEYEHAPLRRFGATFVAVDNHSQEDITALFPTVQDCGDSAYCHLMVSFIGSTLGVVEENALLSTVVVTDDAGAILSCYPYFGEEETDGTRVRGLFARDPATNLLLCPDGVQNRVLLRNDSDDELVFLLVWEIPTLDWRLVIPQALDNGLREQWAAQFEAAPFSRRDNTQIAVPANGSVEITALCPFGGQTALFAPYFNLHVVYAPETAGVPLVVVVGNAAADAGGYLPTPGSLLALANGHGGSTANRVRLLRPRVPDGVGATLLDGNRIWVVNQDAQNQVAANVFTEVPLLAWR